MIQQRLLDILVCPKCKGPLTYHTKEREELQCNNCKLGYAVIDDIPDMLIDDARKLDD